MICTCGNFQRLLCHQRLRSKLAQTALAASPTFHHTPLPSLLGRGSSPSGAGRSRIAQLQRGRSQPLCSMIEVAHAPAVPENGATESDIDALKRQISELQVCACRIAGPHVWQCTTLWQSKTSDAGPQRRDPLSDVCLSQ